MALTRAHITSRFLCASAPEKLYWPVLALVSWMLFSFSQISLFTTGIFSVVWQSCLLFTTLGAYFLWRYPERLSAAAASSVLGLLACWNLAVGLPAWLAYFSIILLRGSRKAARCMVIAAGMAIASLPYLLFLLSGSNHSRKFSDQYVHWFDPTFFVNALGRPFVNDIGSKFGSLPGSELAGTVGLIGFAVLASLMIASVRLRQVLVPCFILCAWSLILIAIIGVVRSGIAPWYALIAAGFWSGLTAACTFVIAESVRSATQHKNATHYKSAMAMLSLICPGLVLLAVAAWTWQCNRSYIDKQYYLENRTPVAASILRNYDIAPEALASYVFKLPGLNTAVTGKMLERNQWSVFSRRQTWQMQGDSIFSLAEGYPRGVDLSRSLWINGKNKTSGGDFRSFKHLNLCVPQGGMASWRVALPRQAQTIFLKTAIALDKQGENIHRDMRMDPDWSIALAGKRAQTAQTEQTAQTAQTAETKTVRLTSAAKLDWQPIRLDLSEYRGEDLSILFGNSSQRSAVVFEYPVIELR